MGIERTRSTGEAYLWRWAAVRTAGSYARARRWRREAIGRLQGHRPSIFNRRRCADCPGLFFRYTKCSSSAAGALLRAFDGEHRLRRAANLAQIETVTGRRRRARSPEAACRATISSCNWWRPISGLEVHRAARGEHGRLRDPGGLRRGCIPNGRRDRRYRHRVVSPMRPAAAVRERSTSGAAYETLEGLSYERGTTGTRRLSGGDGRSDANRLPVGATGSIARLEHHLGGGHLLCCSAERSVYVGRDEATAVSAMHGGDARTRKPLRTRSRSSSSSRRGAPPHPSPPTARAVGFAGRSHGVRWRSRPVRSRPAALSTWRVRGCGGEATPELRGYRSGQHGTRDE